MPEIIDRVIEDTDGLKSEFTEQIPGSETEQEHKNLEVLPPENILATHGLRRSSQHQRRLKVMLGGN